MKTKKITGWKWTKKSRKKASISHLGKKRLPHSEETRNKIRMSNIGKKRSEETKQKMRKPKSEEHKKKLREAAKKRLPVTEITKEKLSKNSAKYWKNKRFNKKHRKNLSKAHRGIKYYNRKSSSPLSIAHRRNISESNKGKHGLFGEDNPNWIDGRTKENNPYPEEWIETSRESIRQRDNYICQLCGIHQEELIGWNKKLDIHHKDYDKENCNPSNLITLCRSCHLKTNSNRKYWLQYFNNIL